MDRKKALLLLVLLAASWFINWRNYAVPNSLVWDEHFHVASAQKYLQGIYFQEPHPPLGKLFIALGEKILSADTPNEDYVNYDRIPKSPPNFSPKGYRLFPLLFTIALPLLLFDFLSLITVGLAVPFCISAFLLLDTALYAHLRAAHLEAFQIAFMLACLCSFARSHKTPSSSSTGAGSFGMSDFWLLLSGIFFGLACGVKVTSAILFPIYLFAPGGSRELRRYLNPVLALVLSTTVFLAAFFVHFSIANKRLPTLPDQGYYSAPKYFQPYIDEGMRLTTFPNFMKDWWRFFKRYEAGVPRLNLCKSGENGSYPLIWPLGGGTISYSWIKEKELTRYRLLLPNPVSWWLSLVGFFLGFTHLIRRVTHNEQEETELRVPLILIFTLLYFGYYAAMFKVDRVMYLYHAFIPLIFGLILLALTAPQIRSFFGIPISQKLRSISCYGSLCLAILSFSFFFPLVGFQPVTSEQFAKRQWFDLWNVRCAGCISKNPLALPMIGGEEKRISKDHWKVLVDGVKPTHIEQEWGEPQQNRTVDNKLLSIAGEVFESGVGVHARSLIGLKAPADSVSFVGSVGVADEEGSEQHGSVVFEIRVNSKILFTSPVMRSQQRAMPFLIAVRPGDEIQLLAYDAGDGKDYDHACWLNPKFIRKGDYTPSTKVFPKMS